MESPIKPESQISTSLPRRERLKGPQVEIKNYYSAHGTEEDFKGLKSEFDQCDIFIPEFVGWRKPNDQELLQDIAKGYVSPEFALRSLDILPDDRQNPFSDRIYMAHYRRFEIIHNSQKPIILVDIEDDNPLTEERRRISVLRMSIKNHTGASFDKLMHATEEFLNKEGDINKRREEYIEQRLENEVDNLEQHYPSLVSKGKISVLVEYGARHTWVNHELRRRGYEYRELFAQTPFIIDLESEAVRRVRFGKEMSRDLIAKVLLGLFIEDGIESRLHSITRDSQKIMQYQRSILNQFSIEDIESLFTISANSSGQAFTLFLDELKEKQLVLPSSEEELDAFLATNAS